MSPPTALQNTCVLKTPSPLINEAFRAAKDNIARCMRYYSLGWGMSNSPHNSTIVVGRDTGWMCIGADYVAPWFAPKALGVFRDRQKSNGQILEYVDLESGFENDYGLNIADNTPHYIWAVWKHWKQFNNSEFRQDFLSSVIAAANHLVREIRENGLLYGHPDGVETRGTTSWRNIIPGKVLAGEVTEICSLSAMALSFAAEFTGNSSYSESADRVRDAVNSELWNGDFYLLNRFEGIPDPQITGDGVFPVLCGIAPPERAAKILSRLSQPDFWNERGMHTVPDSDPGYHPNSGNGLIGGSWPNLTLWYAAAAARKNPDAALRALEIVARPVVESQPSELNVHIGEFPEYYDGDTGVNLGMHLSPWVAPTFIWAVLEGLLGLTWDNGEAHFNPNWPTGWNSISVKNLPSAAGLQDFMINRT